MPETESRGRLDPPRRPPPTAVGAGTPEEEEPRRPAELYDRARFRVARGQRLPLPLRLAGSVFRGARRVVRRRMRKVLG